MLNLCGTYQALTIDLSLFSWYHPATKVARPGHTMTTSLETDQSSSLPIVSGLSALGQQAQHFRCQVASGIQQRFDGAARAFSERFPQQRYDLPPLTISVRTEGTGPKQQFRVSLQVSGQAGLYTAR